jgi:hypothetical protein
VRAAAKSDEPVTKERLLTWWRNFFGHVRESRFLSGMTSGSDGRPPFIADFEWLIRPENHLKVREGKYHEAAA